MKLIWKYLSSQLS